MQAVVEATAAQEVVMMGTELRAAAVTMAADQVMVSERAERAMEVRAAMVWAAVERAAAARFAVTKGWVPAAPSEAPPEEARTKPTTQQLAA